MDPARFEMQDQTFGPLDEASAKRVQAAELYRIYSQNINVGANPYQRFYKQQLIVTGVANGLNRRLPSHPYIELRTHDREGFVYAELDPASTSLLSTIVPGAELHLLCWGNGMIAGSPLLTGCRNAQGTSS